MSVTHVLIVTTILLFPILVELFGGRALGKVKNYFLAAATALLLALDWAALHDIVGGRELNYRQEYTILLLSVGVLAFLGLRRKTKATVVTQSSS